MKRIAIIAGLVCCMGLLFCWSAQADKLYDAAVRGDVAKVRQLLEKGADVNVGKGTCGGTPLHVVAAWVSWSSTEVAKLLIEKGADVNARNCLQETPLHRVASSYLAMAKLLIEKGADVNARDSSQRTPLHNAARMDDTQTAALLIAKGADVNAKTNHGATALNRATSHGHEEIVQLLKQAGAKE